MNQALYRSLIGAETKSELKVWPKLWLVSLMPFVCDICPPIRVYIAGYFVHIQRLRATMLANIPLRIFACRHVFVVYSYECVGPIILCMHECMHACLNRCMHVRY